MSPFPRSGAGQQDARGSVRHTSGAHAVAVDREENGEELQESEFQELQEI